MYVCHTVACMHEAYTHAAYTHETCIICPHKHDVFICVHAIRASPQTFPNWGDRMKSTRARTTIGHQQSEWRLHSLRFRKHVQIHTYIHTFVSSMHFAHSSYLYTYIHTYRHMEIFDSCLHQILMSPLESGGEMHI